MSHRKTINESSDLVTVAYQNKIAQLNGIVGARKTYINLGRGSAKTTELMVERLIDINYDMPGAPIVWVADTYTNLQANILPAVLEGLERKGWKEGVHFVVDQAPPEFTEEEKRKMNLPDWLRPHFWKPFNKLATYKRTIIFYTGLNIRFGSLDRPSSLAGGSFVFVFGDEGKYFNPQKIANLLKANRGYYAQYGRSIFYRGVMFTSDMADTSHIGEYDWMEKEAKNMDVEAILLVIRAGLVYNQALHEYVAAKEKWLKTGSDADLKTVELKLKTANRWKARWETARRQKNAGTFYMRASSYSNADILTAEWFADAIASGLPDVRTAILSLKSTLESGERFYASLAERHFYFNGYNEKTADLFGLQQLEDCRVLKYLNLNNPLRLGVDFGNMCSMSCAQLQKDLKIHRDILRVLKFIYTLAPEYLPELGAKFRRFFAPMKNKTVYLYYDRAGNNYKQTKRDQASELKKSIEKDENGRPTGWTVHLMSIGQGNLRQSEEYHFMEILLGETNPRLPIVRIDAYAAKELKLSLENARSKVKDGIVYKDKSSEKLPISDLPTKSTNPSDSFKYLCMTKDYVAIVKSRFNGSQGNIDMMIV